MKLFTAYPSRHVVLAAVAMVGATALLAGCSSESAPPTESSAPVTTDLIAGTFDQATADLLPSDQFETRRLPARPVRGFGPIEPVAVRRH